MTAMRLYLAGLLLICNALCSSCDGRCATSPMMCSSSRTDAANCCGKSVTLHLHLGSCLFMSRGSCLCMQNSLELGQSFTPEASWALVSSTGSASAHSLPGVTAAQADSRNPKRHVAPNIQLQQQHRQQHHRWCPTLGCSYKTDQVQTHVQYHVNLCAPWFQLTRACLKCQEALCTSTGQMTQPVPDHHSTAPAAALLAMRVQHAVLHMLLGPNLSAAVGQRYVQRRIRDVNDQ